MHDHDLNFKNGPSSDVNKPIDGNSNVYSVTIYKTVEISIRIDHGQM